MKNVAKIQVPAPRMGGHRWGLHRVLEPVGVFPQAAQVLDTSLPIFQNEVLIEVHQLVLDSASFRQLCESENSSTKGIAERILEITRNRGKMQNPVTGSGGMLIGKVLQVGEECSHPFSEGDKIATLVSLTLTPLFLEKIEKIHLESGRIEVQGYAVLFASGVAAPLPQDLDEKLSLEVLDVCGAPAWVRRLIQPESKVLIIGLGKAGLLSALAAIEVVGPKGLWITDFCTEAKQKAIDMGWGDRFIQANAKQPADWIQEFEKREIPAFDVVIQTANAPETEMAAILATRPGGKILFFNMATNFSRACLSAEGIGRDIEMLMGNGFAKGHWEYALELIRKHREVRPYFEE